MRKCIQNMIRCPDGTILKSTWRHDFKGHTQEDGRYYAVDGGLDYTRILHSDDEYTNMQVFDGDPHAYVREVFTWTRCMDAEGNLLDKPEPILLKDITNDHLTALIKWTENYPEEIHKIFLNEAIWRSYE